MIKIVTELPYALTGCLMDGRALTAREVARESGVTLQTASGHLIGMCEKGLLVVYRQGGRDYYRLASPAVVQTIESLTEASQGNASAPRPPVFTGPRDRAMRTARTCYNHLAGTLGVALADALAAGGYVELSPEDGAVTEAGLAFLADFGLALKTRPSGARLFCRPCLDWSERRLHIGGGLGAALAARCFALGWIERLPGSRAVAITAAGRKGFAERLGLAV